MKIAITPAQFKTLLDIIDLAEQKNYDNIERFKGSVADIHKGIYKEAKSMKPKIERLKKRLTMNF